MKKITIIFFHQLNAMNFVKHNYWSIVYETYMLQPTTLAGHDTQNRVSQLHHKASWGLSWSFYCTLSLCVSFFYFGQILEYGKNPCESWKSSILWAKKAHTSTNIWTLVVEFLCIAKSLGSRTWVVPCGGGMLLIILCLRDKSAIFEISRFQFNLVLNIKHLGLNESHFRSNMQNIYMGLKPT